MSDSSSAIKRPNTPAQKHTTSKTLVHDRKVFNCEFTWVIKNFNLHYNTRLRSQPFTPDNINYDWIFELQTGDDVSHYEMMKSLTLYLKPANGNLEKFGPTSGELNVAFIDSKGEKKDIHLKVHYNTTRGDNYVFNCELIRRADLFSEPNKSLLLPQDELRIYCNFSFVFLDDTSPYNFTEKFRKYFKNEESSDLVINVKGKNYPAHKFVLIAHSPVFEAMFAHDTMENQQSHIDINDIDENIFLEMLRFMYTGYVENLKDIATDLIIAADKYNVKKLRLICEVEIITTMTERTAVKTLLYSETYNLLGIKEKTLQYFVNNLRPMVKSKELNGLTSHPELLIDLIKAINRRDYKYEYGSDN